MRGAAMSRVCGVTRAVLDPQELKFGERRRRPAAVRSTATRRRTSERRSGTGHHVGQQRGHHTGRPSHRSGGAGRIRVLHMPLAAALAVITGAGRGGRHGVHVHARSRSRTVVPMCGPRHRSETMHTEQTQQQSAHEQPTGPQRRLRSSELYEALHSAIVGTGHGSPRISVPPKQTRSMIPPRGIHLPAGTTRATGLLLTAAVSFFGLRAVADGLGQPAGESGHSHGDATEEETDEHGAEEESSAPASESSPAPKSSATPEAESGHTEDGHGH